MEKQQTPTKKIALNYGMYLAGLSILLHVYLFAMGKHLEQDWKVTVLGIAITAALIWLGIKKYKEANGGGSILFRLISSSSASELSCRPIVSIATATIGSQITIV